MPCDRCGAVHGPWGVHSPADAITYAVWVTTEGSVEGALTVRPDNDRSAHAAREWFTSELERFAAEEPPTTLAMPVAVLQLGFDNARTHWGPGYGPMSAPAKVLRPLSDLVGHALEDLSRHVL
jgi:hypothetical protein